MGDVKKQLELDKVFHSLSDWRRREALRMISERPCTVSEVARSLDLPLQNALKHVKVLEGARLVTSSKRGRERYCSLQPDGLKDASDWITFQFMFWANSLSKLNEAAKKMADNQNMKKATEDKNNDD